MSGAPAPVALKPSTAPSLRDLLALALPIMASNATAPLVGFVDAVVVGQLGSAHLIGGVAMAATIFSAIFWIFGFLRMGTTGFTAQAHGAGDADAVAATLGRALLIAVVCGLAVVLMQKPLQAGFLAFLGGSENVQAAAREYYDIRIWAAPAGLVNFALMGWLIGRGRTMTSFWLQLGLNVANILFSLLFTIRLGWGVTGVGLAALIAEWLAAFAGLAVAARDLKAAGARLKAADIFDPVRLKSMLAANRDIMIRTACVLAVSQIFVKVGASQGDVALAANVVLANLLYITYYMLDGYAFATETLVGQAIGAKDRARLDGAVRVSFWAAGITGIAAGLVIWLTGPALVAFMTTDPDVRTLAASFLPWAAVLPFIAVWCFQYDGIFIGATRTVDMRNMMILSFAIYLAAVFVLVPLFANHGIWMAQSVFFAVRAVTLAVKYPALAATAGPAR